MAHPKVTVEVGAEPWAATAHVAVGQERDRLWADAVENYPFLAGLQAKITCQIRWSSSSAASRDTAGDRV